MGSQGGSLISPCLSFFLGTLPTNPRGEGAGAEADTGREPAQALLPGREMGWEAAEMNRSGGAAALGWGGSMKCVTETAGARGGFAAGSPGKVRAGLERLSWEGSPRAGPRDPSRRGQPPRFTDEPGTTGTRRQCADPHS